MPEKELAVLRYGRLGYAEATGLQARLIAARQTEAIGDVLVLLEHPPVVTLGRNAKTENVLLPAAELARRGIDVAECDRGGDVTYHGPGQLVGYPILDLHQVTPRLGPVDYVRRLEEVLIATAEAFGVKGQRIQGLTGAWTATDPARKFAAIGVHFARGVTSHGFALNIDTDLSGFEVIVPCGIHDHGVTSLAREACEKLDREQVEPVLLRHFLRVFDRKVGDNKGLEEMIACR